MEANELNQMFKDQELHRDKMFQIKLEDERCTGMDLTHILVTTNGTNWGGFSLKKSEIELLIKNLQEHIA